VILNLWYSADETDKLHFIRCRFHLKTNQEISHLLELLNEAEFKPDFVDYLFFPLIINLLVAYSPLILGLK